MARANLRSSPCESGSGTSFAIWPVSPLFLRLSGSTSNCFPVNATTAALTFLLAVLLIATVWGLAAAVTTSLAAVLAFNFFFLPPVTTFTVEDPQNWVALLAFLITAITASQLSARAQRRTIEAQRRRRETEQLYALGRAILLDDSFDRILPNTVTDIARIFEVEQVALYDAARAETYRHGEELSDAELRPVVQSGVAFHDPVRRYSIAPVHLGGKPVGSLAIRGETVATPHRRRSHRQPDRHRPGAGAGDRQGGIGRSGAPERGTAGRHARRPGA